MYSGMPRIPRFEDMLVHEERHLVAISKPAGLLSQRDHTGEASAICMAAEWLASTSRPGRAHLVHRLDRRVSGLLLIARSTKAASRLSQSFAKRDVLKTYLALCDRSAHAPALTSGTEGRITATLRFDPQRRRAVAVPVAAAGERGARSVSLGFTVLGVSDGHALLAVRPREGFKHQIRALLASHALPLLGDVRYGGPQCEALSLHAAAVRLLHPVAAQREAGQLLQLTADVPDEWGTAAQPVTRGRVCRGGAEAMQRRCRGGAAT